MTERGWADMSPRARLDAARALILEGIERLVEAKLELSSGELEYYDQTNAPLGRRRFTRLARAGAFPAKKIGRRWLVRRGDLDNYISAHGIDAAHDEESLVALRDRVLGRAVPAKNRRRP